MTEPEVGTEVDRVTVYRNGALVTRRGVFAAAGAQRVARLGVALPLCVDPNSVQVRLLNRRDWRVVSVSMPALGSNDEGASAVVARVELEGSDDVQAALEVDYFVPGPTWFASYSLRLKEPIRRGALTVQAFVCQATGEDWRSVSLRLSTAKYRCGELGTRLRHAGPWRRVAQRTLFVASQPTRRSQPPLSYALASPSAPTPTPYPSATWMNYASLQLQPRADGAAAALLPRAAGEEQTEQVRQAKEASVAVQSAAPPPSHTRPNGVGGEHFSYTAVRRADVLSNGKPTCCLVSETSLTAETRFVIVPRESDVAYRQVDLQNDSNQVLLQGPVDVYIGGVYVMTTTLGHTGIGATARLNVGTESQIRVVRTDAVEESSAGVLRGGKEFRHRVEIELQNRTEVPVAVEVRERVPVAKDHSVKVSIEQVQPPWGRLAPNRPDRPGRYRWREQLDVDETKRLFVRYVLRAKTRQAVAEARRRGQP